MEENKKVILLIGSAPFGGDPTNPTYELAKLLNGTVYKDYVFRSASFPVSRRQCIPAMEPLYRDRRGPCGQPARRMRGAGGCKRGGFPHSGQRGLFGPERNPGPRWARSLSEHLAHSGLRQRAKGSRAPRPGFQHCGQLLLQHGDVQRTQLHRQA